MRKQKIENHSLKEPLNGSFFKPLTPHFPRREINRAGAKKTKPISIEDYRRFAAAPAVICLDPFHSWMNEWRKGWTEANKKPREHWKRKRKGKKDMSYNLASFSESQRNNDINSSSHPNVNPNGKNFKICSKYFETSVLIIFLTLDLIQKKEGKMKMNRAGTRCCRIATKMLVHSKRQGQQMWNTDTRAIQISSKIGITVWSTKTCM